MEAKVYCLFEGRTATVVLNRPDKLNALDTECLDLLDACCEQIEASADVRAVVVRGQGKAFCTGADLQEIDGLLAREGGFASFLERWHRVFSRLDNLPVPTVAAVHGHALAGGFELLQACDVVILSTKARVGDQHARYGLFPGGGSTQRLIRQIGLRPATWLLVSGEPVTAAEALDLGLATAVAEEDDFEAQIKRHVDVLLERSPNATAQILRAIRAGCELPLGDALALERELAVEHMLSEDAQIGLKAFRDRSTPAFPPRRVAT